MNIEEKATAALRALVELARTGVPMNITGTPGELTVYHGEDGAHVHLARYDEDQAFSVPRTAESLADAILEIRSTAVSKWCEMTDEDQGEILEQCLARSDGVLCALPEGHEGRHGWEAPLGSIPCAKWAGGGGVCTTCRVSAYHHPGAPTPESRLCKKFVRDVLTSILSESDDATRCWFCCLPLRDHANPSDFVPWPEDRPKKYNGRGAPCDMWTGPCSCGATHEEGV